MPAIPFTKMQGLGNDYIYVNVLLHPIDDPAAFSRRWSDRRTGVGSDGLILIGGSQCADFSMRIFNADGSEGRMCGNGARCVGKYLHDKGLTDKTVITLETLSGIKTLELDLDKDGAVRTVTVGMGKGIPRRILLPRGGEGVAVDVGNPHLVLFVPEDPRWKRIPCSRTESTSSLCAFWTRGICACGSGSAAAASRLPAGPAPALRWSPRRWKGGSGHKGASSTWTAAR